MPKEERKPYDHEETYDQILKPLMEKMERVCRAFEIPYVFVTQPVVRENGIMIRGSAYTPEHTEATMMAAARVATARSAADLEDIIVSMATSIATHHIRGIENDGLRELFEGVTKADSDKPVN